MRVHYLLFFVLMSIQWGICGTEDHGGFNTRAGNELLDIISSHMLDKDYDHPDLQQGDRKEFIKKMVKNLIKAARMPMIYLI